MANNESDVFNVNPDTIADIAAQHFGIERDNAKLIATDLKDMYGRLGKHDGMLVMAGLGVLKLYSVTLPIPRTQEMMEATLGLLADVATNRSAVTAELRRQWDLFVSYNKLHDNNQSPGVPS